MSRGTRLLPVVTSALVVASAAWLAAAQDETPKPPSEAAQRLERLKGLAGTWKTVTRDADELMQGEFHYRVTAAGSAVMETLFVGTPHEMITMYTLDGDDLILTHYCAARNQPRMKAEKGGDADTIRFAFDSLGNGDPAKDVHMHEGKLIFIDANRIRAEYQGWEGGKPDPNHKAVIELERVK